MTHTSLPIWCATLTVVLVGMAMITDLRWRRIPNFLTLPAFVAAIVLRTVIQGWSGLGMALGGAVIAPLLLLLMHGGKGLGMGDLKLAMALGAILGPVLGVAAMLLTAVAGGFLGIIYSFKPGGFLSQFLSTISIGLPFASRQKEQSAPEKEDESRPAPLTMPYGVAIGVGTLVTLAVCWWTGQDTWFHSFAGIAASL